MSAQARWLDGPSPLGLARVLFGALVLCRTTPVLAGLRVRYLESTSPLLGWPSEGWHFAACGLALPAGLVATLCVARTLLLVVFAAGIRAREAGVSAALLGWGVLAQDPLAYVNTLQLLYLGLVVLALGGAGSALAVLPEREIDPASGRALVQSLVVSVYAWSAMAKLNGSWLSGEALAHWHALGAVGGPFVEAVVSSPATLRATAWLVVVTEFALGPLLLLKRTRGAALVAALAFHAVLEVTVRPDFFGFAMAILLVAFVGDPRLTGSATTPRCEPTTR